MTVCGKHENDNFCFVNLVNQPMLFVDATAPLPRTITGEWFRLSRSGARVFSQLVFQLQKFLKGFRIFLSQLFSLLDGLLTILK